MYRFSGVYIGCYVDSGTRDIDIPADEGGYYHWTRGIAMTREVCNPFCKSYGTTYYSLQNA